MTTDPQREVLVVERAAEVLGRNLHHIWQVEDNTDLQGLLLRAAQALADAGLLRGGSDE